MLEILILVLVGVWLIAALRFCRGRKGGCGGSCDGCCSNCSKKYRSWQKSRTKPCCSSGVFSFHVQFGERSSLP